MARHPHQPEGDESTEATEIIPGSRSIKNLHPPGGFAATGPAEAGSTPDNPARGPANASDPGDITVDENGKVTQHENPFTEEHKSRGRRRASEE